MHNPFWGLIYLHTGIGAILIHPKKGLLYFVIICLAMTLIQYYSHAYHFAITYTMLPQWIILLTTWFLTRAIGKRLTQQNEKLIDFQQREMNYQKLKRIGSISAGIIHEIGTPLNTVRLKLDKLQKANDEDFEVMNQALSQCEETLNKINSIQNETSQPVKRYDLCIFIKEYIESIPKINVELSQFENGQCSFSKINLTIVLKVVLDNAYEAGASKIKITGKSLENKVVLKIFDNGPGFNNFILENFGSPYITTRGRGHGLGLFTSLMNIEAMGGTMSINNTNRGSCIQIELLK